MEDTKVKKSHKSSSKHKHKKSKKHKKQRETRSSSNDSDSDKMEWVEAPAAKVQVATEKHDAWMQEEMFVSTLTKEEMTSGLSSREKKRRAEMQLREKEEEVKRNRELNPHWQNNGSGLPEEDSDVGNLRLPATSVGDGGYGHLKKAYLRLQEQAQREGRSMEEVAVERWGSLSKLVSMIDEAETRMQSHSKSRYSSSHKDQWNDRGYNISERFEKPTHHHHSSSPERSFRFQKPKDSDRNRKKAWNISSSAIYKTSHTPQGDDLGKEHSSSHYKKGAELPKEKDIQPEISNIISHQQCLPAWKKVKHPEENKITSPACEDRFSPEPYNRLSPHSTDHLEGKRNSSTDHVGINSEDDLNRLASKYMKADLMGEKELASKLKRQLDEARESFKSGQGSSSRLSSRGQEKVMLTKVDSSGQQRPILSSREDAGFERRTGQKQKKSNKYFDDANKYSLKQMFEREKLTTTEDNLEMFLEVSAQCQDSLNDTETSGITKKASQKMDHGRQEEKDIGRAIHQHQKLSAALEKCEYCLDQPNMKRHLIVKICEQVLLCIPNYQTLTEGHCLIVPKRHVPSFLGLDEDEWREFEDSMCLLRQLFRKQHKSVLFIETSLNFGRCPHAVVECIPVPEEDGDMAPLYFKKAILESEEEWAHNIKLVDLNKKGLRRSVPKNLPYFCVLFDPAVHAGYAHVIENEKSFPRNFGKEVIGGMLDIDYNHVYKNRWEDPLKKSKEALEFTKLLEDIQSENS